MIAEVIRGHAKALFDIVADVLPDDYGMMDRTKCLNTAVMVLYALTGEQALQHTRHCDVVNVVERYAREGNRSGEEMTQLASSMGSPEDSDGSESRLYYVMITDADLENDGGVQLYFPGHVFVIERSGGMFQTYQSYIKRYDLEDYLDNVRSTARDDAFLRDIATELAHLFSVERWDARCSRFWRRFTHAPGDRYEGFKVRDRLLLCFRELSVSDCAAQLRKLLQDALSKAKAQPPSAPYSLTRAPAGALTSAEVVAHAQEMLRLLD